MDDIIEMLIEEIVEGAVEGIDSASTSNRLPVGVRILFAVLLFVILGGALGLEIFTGVMVIKENGPVLLGVIMFAIAALTMGYLIWKFRKIMNRRN